MTTLYFPQLAPGSIAQYPITRRWSKAAWSNVLTDGAEVTMIHPAPARVAWTLRYAGLCASEWESIQALFDAVEGRFGIFTFLDPTDNLLSWTEDFSADVWAVDPLVQISGSVRDPMGGEGATRLTNTAQTFQKCTQELKAPSDFMYSLSVYLRADAACTVNLIRSNQGEDSSLAERIGDQWTRVISSGSLGSRQDRVRFGVELPAGASVCLYAPQVEAQPCAGRYKPNLGSSGVYPNSRFDQDELVQTATAVGQYSTTIQITSAC